MSYENENRNNEYSSTQNTNQSYNGYTQSTGQPYGDWQNGGQAYNEAQNAGQPYSGNGNKKKPHKNTWPKKVAGVCACAVLFGAVAGCQQNWRQQDDGDNSKHRNGDHTFRSSADRE